MYKPNLTTEQFIQKAKEVHGDKYDYSLVEYVTAKTKVKIVCPIHGIFEQAPTNHISGKNGCSKCSNKYSYDTNEFIRLANIKHHNLYNYSNVIYRNSKTMVTILCSIHGVFEQLPNNHLQGQGCPNCKESKGELLIRNYLKSHSIIYESQKRFIDCRYKRTLPFDFYLPEHNTCIEFDGEQHYRPHSFSYNKTNEEKIKRLNDIQFKDMIKNEYCHNNNIRLIRIPYWKINIIDSILLCNLQT